MKKFIITAVAATALAVPAVASSALLMPATASAATYTYCGTVSDSSGTCGQNNFWGAVWDKPALDRTKYKLCVNPPSGNTDCDRHYSSRRGYDAVNLYMEYYRAVGRYEKSPGGRAFTKSIAIRFTSPGANESRRPRYRFGTDC